MKIITGHYHSYETLTSAIHAFIQKDMKPILSAIAEEIKKMLHDYVQTYWYNDHTPKNYHRTYEFINSLTVDKVQTVGDRQEVFIFFDPNKIGAYQTELGQWNQHLDIYGIESAAEAIALWIEEGQDSPLYSYEGIHMVESTELTLRENNKLAKDIAALLLNRGYIVKVK
jgi:hypothetical protein